jgi:hypothetical protein
MLKKILIAIAVLSFSIFWWIGFSKVMNKNYSQTDAVSEALGFPGR